MAKILLVEDDNNLREIYEARLQAEGYEIVSARDGEEALTVAMKERPDLIISDVMMPKISGFDMLDIIRSTEETKDAKVIMMTALSQAEDKARADKLGADRYLVKSQVTLEDVAKVAREVLEGSSNTPAPAPLPETPATPTPAATPAPAVQPQPAVAPPQPVPQPTAAPSTDNPDPATTQPAVVPAPEPATPTAQPTPAPAPDPAQATPPADDTAAINQTVEDEQSAIAAQIESFIDSKKTSDSDSTSTAAPDTATPTETDAPEAPATPQQPDGPAPPKAEEPASTETSAPTPSTKKKVIQPLNDLTKSSGPDLEKLAEKEVAREQMQQIAYEVAASNATRVEETQAADVLRKAQPSGESVAMPDQTDHVAPEVNIKEDGTLNIPEPAPTVAPKPTVAMPIHTAPDDGGDTAEKPAETPAPEPESPEEGIEAPAPASTVNPETSTAPEIPNVAPQPEAAPQPAPVPEPQPEAPKPEPVIPHTNGSSIDGVVNAPGGSNGNQAASTTPIQPQQPTQPNPQPSTPAPDDNDPSAIAL